MNIKIQTIQINQLTIYNFSSFPEDRIRTLISELNIHYDKINNYLESAVSGERLAVEVIESLAKLNEINRIAPCRLDGNPGGGDFRLGIDLLESVIAILSTSAGHHATKKNLLNLGWSLLNKLYNFSFDSLVDSANLHQWLKKNGLVRSHGIERWGNYYNKKDDNRVKFKPSDDELDYFFQKNQQKIFEHMVFNMTENKEEIDPFSDQQAIDFYHYHQNLMNFENKNSMQSTEEIID